MLKKSKKEISMKDLQKLYEYAEKIAKIGEKYGLTGITRIFLDAINHLKHKEEQLEFGFSKKK